MIRDGVNISEDDREELIQIFFETSSVKSFKTESAKQKFLDKYFLNYLNNWPEYLFYYKDDRAMGYICCCPNTEYGTELIDSFPYYNNFQKLIAKYPAHLHINLSEDSRGMGLGSKLLLRLKAKLKEEKVIGLHAVTTNGNKNNSFYLKNGFKAHSVNELCLFGMNLS